jgi:hemoglobin
MSVPRATPRSPRLSGHPDLDSRERIAELVRDFYRDVAMDDLLGPIFAGAHVDWPTHLATLTDFWAKQLLGQPGYDGNPLRAHAPLHARTPFQAEHYQRWLELFTTTVDEHFTGPYAELAKHRAQRMARALERLLGGINASGSAPIEVLLLSDTT